MAAGRMGQRMRTMRRRTRMRIPPLITLRFTTYCSSYFRTAQQADTTFAPRSMAQSAPLTVDIQQNVWI